MSHVPDPRPESLSPCDFALHLSVRSRTVTPCPAPQVLFTVYLLHELKVPGPFKEKTQAKNKHQFSNPWLPKCSEGSCNGYEKRSGRCWSLNATVSMFDNFVWLTRTCIPGGVCSKKTIRTSLFLSDYARHRDRSMRFHTQRPSGSSFPWQSLCLCLCLCCMISL